MAMTVEEAGAILRRMYNNAPDGEMITGLFLFGFEYADCLANLPLSDVIREAGLPGSVEIRHGMKLTKYLQPRPGVNIRQFAGTSRVERIPFRRPSMRNTAMREAEAGDILRRMYNHDAPQGEKSVYLVLFGFVYADCLARLSISQVVRESGLRRSADVQIRHGMKLTRYLQLKDLEQSDGS